MIGKIYILEISYLSGSHEIPKGLKVQIVGVNNSTNTTDFFHWDYKVEVINDLLNTGYLRKGKVVKIDRKTLAEFFREVKVSNNIKKL